MPPALPQLQFFPVLLDWLERHNGAAAGFLAGQMDLSRLGVAGHSRGGKLAALHFASASPPPPPPPTTHIIIHASAHALITSRTLTTGSCVPTHVLRCLNRLTPYLGVTWIWLCWPGTERTQWRPCIPELEIRKVKYLVM